MTLADTRAVAFADLQSLAVTGEGQVTLYDWFTDKVRATPAILVVSPSGTYINGGQGYGEWEIHVDLLLLVAHGEGEMDDMDDLIERTLPLLDEWGIQGVDSVGTTTVGSVDYLGCRIHIARQDKIN